jgi:iron complex transport system substrate-binding protein
MHALENAGIPVVQTELHNTPEGRIQDILVLGYVYGEEARAAQLAAEVRSRYEALTGITQSKPTTDRPAVLSLTSNADKLYVAGRDSTEGSIIEAVWGINAAARAGIAGNQTTSLEGLVAMAPDVMIIPQADGGAAFKQQLVGNPALAQVPAIRAGRVYLVPPKYFTTLSFWNVRGAEELAKLLWPQEFGTKEFPAFSVPKES